MRVDDFNGELVETEDASNAQLAELDRDYTRYLNDPKMIWDGGKAHRDMYVDAHAEITWEIEQRRKEGTWDQ